MSSSSALPPTSNLPSWSRVSTLDRSRYPKPFLRDRIPLSPNGETTVELSNVDVKFLEKMTTNVQHQLINHDKSVKFLQQQHAEILSKLHAELDSLKKENKALQFKVVLAHRSNSPAQNSDEDKVSFSQTAPTDIKTLLLQEEIKDLKRALKESSMKNNELKQTIYKLESRSQNSTTDNTEDRASPIPPPKSDSTRRHRRKYSVSNLSSPLPLNATLNPLQVRDSVNDTPRLPTRVECELIIQQLHEANCLQLQELSRLRSDRRSTTPRSPITLESPVMKEYSGGESFSDTRLPRIPVKPSARKPVKSASLTDMLMSSVPSLQSTMSINPADRHKRQQNFRSNKPSKSINK